jgi:hypothetical protein
MASLSNINGLFDVHSTGAILFSTSHGTSGQILRSNGNAAPTWVAASTVIGGPYLPLTGGTLSGATATATGINFTVGGNLFGTSATFSGNVTLSNGKMQISGPALTDNYLKINVANVPLQNGVLINYAGASQSTGLFINQPNGGGSGAADYALLKVNNQGTNPTFYSSNNGSTPVIIKANGNVGIGITGPTSKLHSVVTTAGDSALKLQDDTGSVFDFQCGIAGVTGDALVIKDTTLSYDYLTLRSGNFGIGTTSPDYDLDVERTATAINDDPTIRVRNAWSGEGNNTGFSNRADGLYTAGSTAVTTRIRSRYDTGANYGEVGTTTNHDFRFITNGGEKMRIDNGGNVRVGTASTPDTLFQIYATTSEDPAAPGTTTTGKFCINTSQQATLSIGKNSGNVYWISNVNKSFANSFYHIALNPLGGRVGIGTISPTQPLDVNGYSICDKQFQRDNSTTIILGTPRILNIGYQGSSGTYDFNPVTLFGNQPQGGQCEIQVTGWQNKVNNGFIYWRDNGSNTNIGNGIVGFVQTAVVGSGVISVSTNAGGNVITITFTGWHSNAHGWNAKIISNNS